MINIYSHCITPRQLRNELMETAQGDADEIHNATIVLCNIVAQQQIEIERLTKQVAEINAMYPSAVSA